MTKSRVAEPDYDFQIETVVGRDVLGKNFFSPEVSIVKCTVGSAMITINSHNHDLRMNHNFMLVDSAFFKVVECSDDFQFMRCRFSLRFFNAIYPMLDNKLINVMHGVIPDICFREEVGTTDLIFQQLCSLSERREHPYRGRLAIYLVVSYILELYDLAYKFIENKVVNVSTYSAYLLDSFFELCRVHHTHHRTIDFYASRLNISSRYLYEITKKALQATPKELIDFYVSGSAKRMLLTTVLNNQQIADQLNFPDQATFGQYFKRNVGMPPSEFRNRYK